MLLLLKNLLFTLVVPGTVGVIVPLLIAGDLAKHDAPASGPALVAATALLTIGTGIYAWCVWDFASFGRGTPAPIDAPKELVVRGLYRVTRNPMYVGVLSVILGWVVRFDSPSLLVYWTCVAIAFHSFIRFYEEPHLQNEFGDAYTRYKDRVGRWLPKLGRPSTD